MTGQQSLIDYIKQNLRNGFQESEIRQALHQAGWGTLDIEDGFREAKGAKTLGKFIDTQKLLPQPANRQKILTILTLALTLPVIGLGSFWLYQKYASPDIPEPEGQVEGTQNANLTSGLQEAQGRDEQRLKDTTGLKQALELYFQQHQQYPPKISELVSQKLIAEVPRDPKSDEPYLYRSLGEPALHYFLAFILETKARGLKPGLQVVYSEEEISPELFQRYQSLISGAVTPLGAEGLKITKLDEKPFLPQEPVTLEVYGQKTAELLSANMIIPGYLEQVDQSRPLVFKFLAPKNPGQYPVYVFGFDGSGQGYFQKTLLVVENP
ncbi:MAG: hypothetical protein HY396_01835 [Candidatus Doudnabacteria bacterium]|nr:hypothetical protein [Candidatus Doudnabacteria bacterium]